MVPTPHSISYDALLGLGSNLGDKSRNITTALHLLEDTTDIRVVRVSRFYKSAPWGIQQQDWFVNVVAAISTQLDPSRLLDRCLEIENRMGRVREAKWGPRVIDVDLLTYRDETLVTERLRVPHPFIEERSFVLVPLQEIAPHQRIRGQDISTLLSKIDVSDVVLLEKK